MTTEVDPAQSSQMAAETQAQAARVGMLRRAAAGVALLGTMAGGAMGGAANAENHSEPSQVPTGSAERIYHNGGDGYSYDVVLPQVAHGHAAHNSHEKSNPPTMLMEGDSKDAITIESVNNIHSGSDMEVWWHQIDPKLGIKFLVVAQGKSGYVKEGETNPRTNPDDERSGTNFMERLDIPKIAEAVTKADMMMIDGGFNDALLKNLSHEEYETAVAAYMDRVLELRTEGGHDPSTVFVTDIWAQGSNKMGYRRIMPVIKEQAIQHGFTFVEEKGVVKSNEHDTIDGIHPRGGVVGQKLAHRFEREAHLSRTVEKILAERT